MIVVEILGAAVGGFALGVAFAGNVRGELEKLHQKADEILVAVRGH